MTQIRADQVQPGMLVPSVRYSEPGTHQYGRHWLPALVIAVEPCPPGWPDGWVRITTCKDDDAMTMRIQRLPPDWLVEVLDDTGLSEAA